MGPAMLLVVAAIAAQDQSGSGDSRIRAGDRLNIAASELLPNNPVKGTYFVEQSGKVALGPEYGRVAVGGKTVEEAEQLVRSRLAEFVREPKVSLTWYDAASHGDLALQERVTKLERQVAELRAALEEMKAPSRRQ
jgi:protein involved in polysaccharide export with SLBB domain